MLDCVWNVHAQIAGNPSRMLHDSGDLKQVTPGVKQDEILDEGLGLALRLRLNGAWETYGAPRMTFSNYDASRFNIALVDLEGSKAAQTRPVAWCWTWKIWSITCFFDLDWASSWGFHFLGKVTMTCYWTFFSQLLIICLCIPWFISFKESLNVPHDCWHVFAPAIGIPTDRRLLHRAACRRWAFLMYFASPIDHFLAEAEEFSHATLVISFFKKKIADWLWWSVMICDVWLILIVSPRNMTLWLYDLFCPFTQIPVVTTCSYTPMPWNSFSFRAGMDDESSHDALDSPAFVGNHDVVGELRVKFGWVYKVYL